MLSPRRAPDPSLAFTRRDATRFLIAAFLLITSLTAIFALDLVPQRLEIAEGDVASADIVAPRFASYDRRPRDAGGQGRGEPDGRAGLRLQHREGDPHRRRPARPVRRQGRADRQRLRGRREAGRPPGRPRGGASRPERRGPPDPPRADVGSLEGRPRGGLPGARRHRARRAARHRRRDEEGRPVGADGGRARRRGADARRGDHRPARRRQQLVQPGPDPAGAGPRRRGHPERDRELRPGRDDRPARREDHRHRHRGHRPVRPPRRPARRAPARRLVPPRGPRRHGAPRLDLAVPAGRSGTGRTRCSSSG